MLATFEIEIYYLMLCCRVLLPISYLIFLSIFLSVMSYRSHQAVYTDDLLNLAASLEAEKGGPTGEGHHCAYAYVDL